MVSYDTLKPGVSRLRVRASTTFNFWISRRALAHGSFAKPDAYAGLLTAQRKPQAGRTYVSPGQRPGKSIRRDHQPQRGGPK